MSDRYTGKPFLKLLDSYVLDAIGALDAQSDAVLTGAEAEFAQVFGESGDWRTIVAKRMQFQDGMQGAIAQVWESGKAKFAAANGRPADPHEFTRIFVDTNFPH